MMNRTGNSTKKITNKEFILLCRNLPDSHNYDFDNTHYVNSRTYITFICKNHGHNVVHPEHIRGGLGCIVCDRITGRNTKTSLNLNQYKIFSNIIHCDRYDYSLLTEENFKNEKIPVICKEHGLFYIRKSAHISPTQQYGCQKCGFIYSRGEEKIARYLSMKGIFFERQKKFDWAMGIGNKTRLPFDFFLPEYNIIIEFDGQHHFKPVRYGNQSKDRANEQHKKTILYDGIKTMNAILKDIKIIRIPFYMNIQEILDNELGNKELKCFINR